MIGRVDIRSLLELAVRLDASGLDVARDAAASIRVLANRQHRTDIEEREAIARALVTLDSAGKQQTEHVYSVHMPDADVALQVMHPYREGEKQLARVEGFHAGYRSGQTALREKLADRLAAAGYSTLAALLLRVDLDAVPTLAALEES